MNKTITQFKWLVTMLLLVTAMVMPSVAWAEPYDENGFAEDGSYQPATPTTNQYDINGDGTKDEVYEIGNAGQLYWFAALVNGDTSVDGVTDADQTACAVLTKNIDCGSKTWTPIGVNGYEGTFDGQGHTISRLNFDNSELNNVGLFGSNSGTIKNVGVVNSYFYGRDFVGGVCGYNNEGIITGCYNTGSVSGNNLVGGVCGQNYGTIIGCYNTGSVSGNSNIGGVCGDNNGTITGCYNTGEVSGKSNSVSGWSNHVGGVCGYNGGIITGCYNTSSVSGDYYVGGVCGDNNGGTITGCYNDNTGAVSGNNDYVGGVCGDNENGGTITSCHNTGSVSGNDCVGGVCGDNSSTITSCYNTGTASGNNWVGGVCGSNSGTITSCYNTGEVSCNFDWVGGVCGSNSGTITGCYNTGQVSGDNQVGGVCGYNSSTITGCYNTGAVSGNDYVGGVCGYNEGGTITGCYNSGTVSGSSYVGGVCGSNVAENATATITNCYYNSEKYTGNAIGTNDGTVTNVEGKTTAQFMSGEVCYLMNNGITDGTQKWHQNNDMEGVTKDPYPVLDNTHGVVYQCSVCTSAYSNTEGAKGAHDYVDDGNGFLTCEACGTKSYQPATQNASNQYEISNAGQLYWFAALVNGELGGETQNTSANAVLTANITVNKDVLDSEGNLNNNNGSGFETWTPIGSYKYTGIFDGQGHTISGLYLDNSGLNNVGLFGSNSGTIKNVGVVNSYFYGSDFVGGVCGYNEGTITGCYNTGSVSGNNLVGGVCGQNYGGIITGCYNDNTGAVSGNDDYVGGVCGKNVNGGTISDCHNTGQVHGYKNCVGGVCGDNSGTITSCYNTGTVSCNFDSVGGVCGSNSGTITSCYNTGTVSCNFDSVGGVCGSNGGKITGCYNTGSVSGHNQVGGVCGYNSSTITGCYNYNTGAVSGSKDVSGSSYVGGVCGYNEGGTITGCYNSGTVSGSGSNVGGVCGYNTGTITGCYTNNEIVCGYDGNVTTDCEKMSDNDFTNGTVCPLLNKALKKVNASVRFYQGANYPEIIINVPSLDDEVYQISNKEELYAFAQLVNKGETSAKAVLTKDIIVNTDVLKSDGTLNNNGSGFEPWTPIGFSFPYEGTFDGQGHTISGLYFKDVYASYVGLFGYSSGTIRNVGVIDSYFKGSDYIGGVCGYNHAEGDFSQATIENCYNTGTVSCNFDTVGGVCGSNGGKITGCYNTGTVSGNSNVGGVCGYGTATIENCYNTGSVSGNIYIGGVCGYNHAEGEYSTVTIENCYNTGTVSGYDNVGGVCGYNHAKSDFSTVTIENCYNTGTVSCNGHYAGGVCGYNYAEGEYSTATIENCYNTGTVSGSGSNVGGVCGYNEGTITNCYYLASNDDGNGGKTTDQFMSGEVCYLMNNVITDGTLTWHQNIDMEGATKDPYPVLDNTHGVVYQCSVCTSAYSNTKGAKGAHDYVDDGNGFLTCEACGTKSYQPATLNASNQYEISNAGQLYWFAALVNGELGGETQNTSANAVLTKDIDCGSKTWTPIGFEIPYEGTFDGQGYTISRLYFDNSELNNVGLFGSNSGTIKNVGVVNSLLCGSDNVGGVCGKNVNGGTITDCYNTGAVSGKGQNTGGVCGDNNGTITGCYNTGTVSGNNQVGGVCGSNFNGGTITDCDNTGAVSGNGSNTGGVCGGNGDTITGCYNSGEVRGNNSVGGVCGYNENGGKITGCHNTELVSGDNHQVGGVCGSNGGTITGCHNTGEVRGNMPVGGVCGSNGRTITGCYNTGQVSGDNQVGGVCGVNGGTITGCYTNSGSVCGYNECTITNCYYLASNDDGNGGKTTEQFSSGEVCYLLSQGSTVTDGENTTYYSGASWGQQLGTDDYPVLSDYKVIKAAEGDNKTYWATFSNQSSDMDLSDLTVYTAKVSKGILTLTPCTNNIVAMGEGVLVKGNSEYLNALMLNDDTEKAEENNDLVATPAEPTVINAATGHVLYRLTYNKVSAKEGLGFYLGLVGESKDGSQLKATPNKAYLDVTTAAATPSSSNAPALGFAFPSDGETTGISEMVIKGNAGISGAANADGRIYNLQGQQVSAPAKGLYIKNHKKVIVK